MELDELKSRWQEQDKKLDDCLRLNQRLLRESLLGKSDTALRRLSRLLWFELVVNVAGAILVGSFLGDHVTETRYLIPAIALQLGLIAVIVAGARQLATIAGIDYAAPIVEIQRRLEALWLQRIRTTQWILILSPLAWTPLLIVGFKWLLNVDVYSACGTPFVVWNLLFGLLVLVLAVWISRTFANRMDRSPVIQRLLQDLGGQNLAAARAFAKSVSEFADALPN
jgi:biotin transporter BioY